MTEDKNSTLRDGIPNAVKAFAVLVDYENTGGIVFAKSNVVARRLGANQYADGEFSHVSCRRAPYADDYAERPMPAWLMVAHGWRFDCSACGVRIDEDCIEEAGLEIGGVIGHQNGHIYCDSVCEAAHEMERAGSKYRAARWYRRFERIILRKFPRAEIVRGGRFFTRNYHSHLVAGKHRTQQIIVSFDFEGRKYAYASLRYDRGKGIRFECSAGDRATFEDWVKAPAMEAGTAETQRQAQSERTTARSEGCATPY